MFLKVGTRAFALPGFSEPTKWAESFTFAVLADPQLGLFRNNHSWEEERVQVQEAIEAACKATRTPAFILILGDLVHAPVPTLLLRDAAECRNVRDAQVRDLLLAIDSPSKDIPLLVLPGNHDIGDAPTPASLADYNSIWGKDYFSFWVGGVKFIALNSCLFFGDFLAQEEAEAQFQWLETELADASENGAIHIFILQHHQFYWKSWDEVDAITDTIDLYQMRKQTKSALFHLPQKWRRRLLPLLKKHKVSVTLHGHLHFESLLEDEGILQIVSSGCGFTLRNGRPGWRLVHVSKENINHEFFPVKYCTEVYPFMPPRFT